jgi:iron complex outermembrane recepter protein
MNGPELRAALRPASVLVAALCTSFSLAHADENVPDLDIFELSELSSQVYSAAKRSQPLGKTPAAAHVITREDIRRSGHTSIPELLRTVPGVNVHRVDSNFWAISIRGGVETYNHSLLVLVDGRSVYSPLFGGTYWDIMAMPLDDIERIEVIRGPGGAVWGANATNGVINIIRRTPVEEGSYVSAGGGSHDRLRTSFGQAATFGEDLRVLFSGHYENRAPSYDRGTGSQAYDNFRYGGGHFRADFDASERSFVRVQGDWYAGDRGNLYRQDTPASLLTSCDASSAIPACAGVPGYLVLESTDRVNGGNLMFGFEHRASEDSIARVDLFWDNYYRQSRIIEETRHTFDLEFRHTLKPLARHTLQWGFGGRLLLDRTEGSFNFAIDDPKENEAIYSAFAEDEIALLDGRLRFTAGSKVEYHTYIGWEVSPSARFAFDAAEHHQVWGAVSRAVRTPARAERDGFAQTVVVYPGFPTANPGIIRGSDDFESEVFVVYELGWRWQPATWLHADLATFTGELENVRNFSGTPGATNPLDLTLNNEASLRTWGTELSLAVQPLDRWKLRGSWTETRRTNGSDNDIVAPHQLALLSYVELPGHLELDTGLYYTARLNVAERPPTIAIPGFWRLDVRLGWAPRPDLELELVGQNLTERRHEEYSHLHIRATAPLQELGTRTNELPRSVHAQVTWRF